MPEHIPWTETFGHQNGSIKSIITGMGISVQHSFCQKKMGPTLEIHFVCWKIQIFSEGFVREGHSFTAFTNNVLLSSKDW
jgi:hypothetical protein